MLVLELVFYVLVEILFYQLGRAAIFVGSLGRVRAQRLRELISKKHWPHADGQVAAGVSVERTQIIGLLVFVAAVTLLIHFAN
jgi:hypothetical protein